ncbi:hypothetical protein [Sphingobacterium luzhongxinii]|uniref:hypothetical protein n=1 Tax=Sphingobacterium luzhongxinii TaxID=2654181 RepID=UPI0013DCA532|nr:hypothetical protein [Sphingobacterium sp. xlx-73]
MTLKEEIKWLEVFIKKQAKAGAEVVPLRSIKRRLSGLEKKEPVSPYHSQAVGVYKLWLEHHGLPALVDARQVKALKEILNKLKNVSKDKTDEAAFDSFQAILHHWGRLGDYLQKRKQLTDINSRLLEIVDKIKHGANKQSSSIMEAEQVHDRLRSKYDYGNGSNG